MELKIINWDDIKNFSDFFSQGTSLTVGSFDGPHRGHDLLFNAVTDFSASNNFLPGVVTFRKSAAVFHSNGKYEGDIATLDQRISVFKERGMSFVILIDFSSKFAKIKGEEFLSILLSVCNMKFIAEGVDFKCGYKGATGGKEIVSFAKEHGIECVLCDHIFDEGERISSTRIRSCVSKNKISEASRLLGRHFAIDAKMFSWQKNDGGICAAKKECSQVLPPDGEYDVRIKCFDGSYKLAKFFVEGPNLCLGFPHEQITKLESIEFI